MLTRSGKWMALVAGVFVLGSLILFCGIAIVSLIRVAEGLKSSDTIFLDPFVWHIAGFTVYQALLSTGFSVLLSIPLAIALHRRADFPGRSLVLQILLVPMRLPTLVVAFALISIWGRNGVINQGLELLGVSAPVSIYGLSGILIAHVFFNIPLSAQILLQGFDAVPAEYWRSAASLGMGPVSTFRFIEWPVIRRLVPKVAGLIFILCVSSFTLVLVLGGGPQATTLQVAIYQALHFDFDVMRAVSLSFLQIGLTILLLGLFSIVSLSNERGTTLGRAVRRFDGSGRAIGIYDGLVLVSAVLFIVSPLAAILKSGLKADYGTLLSTPLFWSAFFTSCLLALTSGLLALMISIVVLVSGQGVRSHEGSYALAMILNKGLVNSPTFVLLLPPVVLATGWFLILPDPSGSRFAAPVLVTIINALMALPFCLRILEPSYSLHVNRTGILAASLQITGYAKLTLIDWPCLRPILLRAFSLAMALSLGDLGAIALFGGDSFVTLPWLLFSKLGSYRSTDADGLALVITLLCLGLATLGYGASNKEKLDRS